jgi:hypothetical protein
MSETIPTLSFTTIATEFPKELERCRELLKDYEAIGPAGKFGHAMISLDIEAAEKAMAAGDCIGMLQAYQALKGCK